MAIAIRRVPQAETAARSEPASGTLAAFLLAAAGLSRAYWGPLLELPVTDPADAAALHRAALVYAGVAIGQVYVFWKLRQALHRLEFHGADLTLLIALSAFGLDSLAHLYLTASGEAYFYAYPLPLGFFRIVVSYPQASHFLMGFALIALGYSLLRFPHDRRGRLRSYGQALIATGAALGAPPLASVWPLPWAVAQIYLGLFFLEARRGVSAPPPR